MKVLRQFILLMAITVVFSLTAMAQKQDDKKNPPPKDPNPPKIRVEDKKDNDKPKDDKKDNDKKKPGMAFLRVSNEIEIV